MAISKTRKNERRKMDKGNSGMETKSHKKRSGRPPTRWMIWKRLEEAYVQQCTNMAQGC